MQASYGRILKRTAVPTAAAAVVMIALCAALGGVKGLIGALLGVALVAVFYGISLVAVSRAARVSPQAMMITAIVTFLAKILALAVLVSRFAGTTAFNSRLFGFTAIACILVWSIGQAVISSRMKVLYVEPEGTLSAGPDGKQYAQPAKQPAKPGGKLYVEPDGKR
jgi:ATP synthase protein I